MDEKKKAMPPQFAAAKDKEKEGEEKEDKEKEEKAKKSLEITEEELIKSVSALEEIASSGEAARKRELLSKAMSVPLEKTERKELRRLLKGKPADSVAETVEKSMAPSNSETLQKALDVSGFLSELHKSLATNLVAVAEKVEKGQAEAEDRTLILAKALVDIGKMTQQNSRALRSIAQKMGIIAQQPARGPKAMVQAPQGAGAPLEKSQMQFSKAEVLDVLDALLQKSVGEGKDGISQFNGESYDIASAKYESTDQISPAMLREVMDFRKRGGRAN